MEHFNKLTPAEDERLACLLEECGEVIQIIGKIQRHGYASYNPHDDQETDNRNLLTVEAGDLLFALYQICGGEGKKLDLDWLKVQQGAWAKSVRIRRYLHHQETP